MGWITGSSLGTDAHEGEESGGGKSSSSVDVVCLNDQLNIKDS